MRPRAFLELARISNLPTVWSNCFAAWLLANDLRTLGFALMGGSLVYTGGMFLNDYCDQKFDRAHRQERPIPSGRSSARTVAILALVLLAAGTGCLAWIRLWPALALTSLVIVYDFWHKGNPISPLLMAGCRVMLVLTVAGLSAKILALSLGLYILAISLVAKREVFGRQTIPWLGLLALVLSFACGPVAEAKLPLTWMWMLPVAALFSITYVLRTPKEIGQCVSGLLAAIPLLDLWNLGLHRQPAPLIIGIFLLMSVSALLLQRVAPAT